MLRYSKINEIMDALPNAAALPGHNTSTTDGPIRDGDDQDELPLEQQPKFTEQDEQREQATLTTQELSEILSDLTGVQSITSGISGLGLGAGATAGSSPALNVYGSEGTVGPGSSPPRPLSTHLLLAALDQHMISLPAKSTEAYFRATTKCPDQVNDERKLLFLHCEEYSIPLAAQRLALYWQYRLYGFGEDRCFEPMTLAGAMRDEVMNMAKSGMCQLMPSTDAAGRAIIYVRLAKRDYSLYSVKQEIMWLTYLLEIVVQHKSLRSRGVVFIADTSGVSRKCFKRQSAKYFARAVNDVFPIRICSMHNCNANPLMTYLIFPVFQRLMPKNIRLRIRLHRSTGEDLLRSLAEFNLPRDRLPSDIGGSVVLNIKQFVIDRVSLEASRAGTSINLPPTEEQSSPGDAGIDEKRQKVSETNTENQTSSSGRSLSSEVRRRGHEQAPPIDNPSSGAAVAAASSGTKASSGRKGARNIIDPRMARAVRAKQDDPDLSLHDALISGGFAFTQKGPGRTDFTRFDEDGISLKQRKNNLCRRLREEQKKEKKRARKTGDNGTTSASVAAMDRCDSLDEGGLGSPGCPDDKDAASILLHFKSST